MKSGLVFHRKTAAVLLVLGLLSLGLAGCGNAPPPEGGEAPAETQPSQN